MYEIKIINPNGETLCATEVDADEAVRTVAWLASRKTKPQQAEDVLGEPQREKPLEQKKRGPKPKPGHGQHKCSNCGEPGHQKRTCPALGHDETRAPKQKEPISESAYDTIKQCKADGMNSHSTALDLGLNEREVNAAWGSSDYDQYLLARKALNKI